MAGNSDRLRILVADDDPTIARTLTQILWLSGYDAEAVGSGEQAMEAAAVRPPDVLVSDVQMGGISGIEAAARILEMVPTCIVILISGQTTTADLHCGTGHSGYSSQILAKPVPPAFLLDRIAQLAAERLPVEIRPAFAPALHY